MTQLVSDFTAVISTLVMLSQIAIVAVIFLLLFQKKSRVLTFISKNSLWLVWIVSLVATGGSLFYSNVAGFDPCDLCWWQRIFMYSQFVIFSVALYKKYRMKMTDFGVYSYSLTLSIIGAAIAAFHYYGQMFNVNALPCNAAVGVSPCAKTFTMSYGYITIPMMALTAFLLLIVIVVINRRKTS